MAKAKTKAKAKKAAKPKIQNTAIKIAAATPVGRVMYPYLTAPDTGRENSANKYTVNLMWPLDEWEEVGRDFTAKVREAAHEAYGKKVDLGRIINPVKFGNDKDNPGVFEDHVYTVAKTLYKPKIYGPKKSAGEWDLDQISTIKSGDYGRIIGVILGYPNNGGGLTFGLNIFQFQQPGEAIGGGGETFDLLGDLEVEIEDIEDEDLDEDVDVDEDEEDEDDF